MDFRGSVKILSKIYSVKRGGLPKFRNSGCTFFHQANTKIQGGEVWDPHPSYGSGSEGSALFKKKLVNIEILKLPPIKTYNTIKTSN